jgi:glycosyltransferase involved in cell wall biosynthesis
MLVTLGAYLLSGTLGYRQAGIHQYSRALIEALAGCDLPAGMQLSVLVSPTALGEVASIPNLKSQISFHAATRNTEQPLGRIRVEQLETPGVLRRLHSDLYHGLAFIAPLRAPCPTVITVHDLSFITRPQTHKRFNRIYLSLFTRLSCRRARYVITVSEWTKHDVVTLLGIDPARVEAIPLGVDPRFQPLPAPEVHAFRQANHIGAQTIFFLGSLEPRKNLPALIEAFHEVLATTPQAELIVGGGQGWKYGPLFERVRALGLESKVRFTGPIDAADLPRWYNACTAFAYPSLYEGFGLPALEAMACGTPVVTSNVTSLPEVVGDAAISVPPTDTHALAEGLSRVLADAALRSSLREQGLRRAGGFTWQRTAERTLEVYFRTLKPAKRL